MDLASRFAIKDFYIIKDDTTPYYYAKIVNSSGVAIDLSGYTVYASMINHSTGVYKFTDVTCTVTDTANGYFEYHWQTGDIDTQGTYRMRFKISNGILTYTLPTSTVARVYVIKK